MKQFNPLPYYISLGNRLRTARVLKGYTQETLGNALDVTFQQVQKYEKGTNRLPVDKLVRIVGVLGLGKDGLLEIIGAVQADSELDTDTLPLSSREAIALQKAFSKLGERQRKDFMRLIKSCADMEEEEQAA